MPEFIIKTDEYQAFILDLKKRIRSAQISASVAVNRELLQLYWELGERIVSKQRNTTWGDGFLQQMSSDLQTAFPDIKGFSLRNIKYMRQWYEFWTARSTIGQQTVAQLDLQERIASFRLIVTQIPWGHNIIIVSKSRSIFEGMFYVQKTIQNNWSRAVLTHQIDSGLFEREGKAVTNFQATLPEPQSDLAKQTLKDPFNFDFLMLREQHDERELEEALSNHLTRFLLELGAGFSFLGRQYRLEVGGDEFFIDLLFYHVKLHCYVVVELKTVKFRPEFAGKLSFYISAVDDILRTDQDSFTIGILICRSKNNTVVEYALRDLKKPIGVSEYNITRSLPDELKTSLPSIEDIEAEIGACNNEM